MQTISFNDADFSASLELLYNRPAAPDFAEKAAAGILEDVRKRGDEAICEMMKKFDSVDITADKFMVTEEEFAEAESLVKDYERAAIECAFKNIQAFARHQIPSDWTFSPRKGVITGEKFTPMQCVGCYIPGGTAPLVSTVLHTAAIAKAAGVKEIIAVTPPRKDGKIHPQTLFAMKVAGVTKAYRMGGAYAIAALAYGTNTVPKVEKIVGPGNAFVAAAKKQVYGNVAIDMVAGPSEIMIVADKNANPAFAAADILSQAEHGSGLEQAVLASDDREFLEKVQKEISKQCSMRQRLETIDRVLDKGVTFIHTKDITQALEIAGKYAPEHLELMFENAGERAKEVTAAGAIFIGSWTPEPAGDFVAGPSHVLPTAGTARFFHGISAVDFLRRSSIIEYTREGLMQEVEHIETFAKMESLDAHGYSGSIRREFEE